MSNPLVSSKENFVIIDGEVNILFYGSVDPSLENSSDKKVNICTNYGTSTSNEPENEYFNQENATSETLIPLNFRESQEERDTTIVQQYQGEDEESLDHQFNGPIPQITATDGRIVEESLSNSEPSEDSIRSQTSMTSINEGNERNDSKNVPKGMMKAFAHMVLDKDQNTVRILKEYFVCSGESYEQFKIEMKLIRKSSKISISEIRSMLVEKEFAATMRKLGCNFLRKRFLIHIFNSKMEKRHIHMKYIPKWMKIFKNPSEFTSIK